MPLTVRRRLPATISTALVAWVVLGGIPVAFSQLPSLDAAQENQAPDDSAPQTILGLDALISPQPLPTPVLSNRDVVVQDQNFGEALERQQRAREMAEKLREIRDTFARGEFQRVLTLIEEAERIDPDNPSLRFYRDWANRKIATGEGPRGAIINNPRLAAGASTPHPAIPTPRGGMRPGTTPAVPEPTPVVLGLPDPTPVPTPAVPMATTLPDLPPPAPQTLSSTLLHPITVAVAVAIIVGGFGIFLLSRRAPIPVAPKHTPVPILPNMLAQAPVAAYPGAMQPSNTATAVMQQDPQTLVVEEESHQGFQPPPMAELELPPMGSFGAVGFSDLPTGMPAPASFEPFPAAPGAISMDALPTVDEIAGQENTQYAIDEDAYEPLPEPVAEPVFESPYDFFSAPTLDNANKGLDLEVTLDTPGPLPPPAFSNLDPNATLPVFGDLPPSSFSMPAVVLPDDDVVQAEDPLAGLYESPASSAPESLPNPFPSLGQENSGDDGAIPAALLGVFPGKSAPAPTPTAPATPPPPTPQDNNAPLILPDFPPSSTTPAPAQSPLPTAQAAPTSDIGNADVINLSLLGLDLTPSAPDPALTETKNVPLNEEKVVDTDPFAHLGDLKLEGVEEKPEPSGSPYGLDSALGATKTLDQLDGGDSIYGIPGLTEDQQAHEMFLREVRRGDHAAAAGDWRKAVHFYAIAAAIEPEHPDLLAKLHDAREKKKQLQVD